MDILEYPKDPQENMRWRGKLLLAAKRDLYFRSVVTELFHKDILFAFNAFFYTLDVRKRPFQHQPFCTWDFQDKALVGLVESINMGRDEVWEKSRDMGASWLALMTFFWFWLSPEGGGDFLLGSRIEDYVDKKGDMRALFPKIRYALYRLPQWLRPKKFKPRKHDTYMKLENSETGSTIIGESNNANFSTGGRFLGVLFDELGKWESTDTQAWTAAGDATPSRLAVSTPFGAGGQYYNLTTDGKTLKRTFHWTEHPEKSKDLSCQWPPPNEEDMSRLGDDWTPQERKVSPWYLKQIARRSKREVAQEIDIDYLGSGNPVFDGKAFDSLQLYLKIPERAVLWGRPEIGKASLELYTNVPEEIEGYVTIYAPFEKGKAYTIGVDVVEGVEGGDYAVVIVYDRFTKSVASLYWSRIDEVLLAYVIKGIYNYYSVGEGDENNPWLGIETNGPGLATFNMTEQLGVDNMFMAIRYDVSKAGIGYKKGWKTDTHSKNELISGVRRWLIDRAGDLNSHRLCGELMTFIRSTTGKAGAKAGCHDDTVISFGICIQLDELCPMPEVRALHSSGPAAVELFTELDWDELRVEGGPETLEERCFADAVSRKLDNSVEMDDFYERLYQ